MHASIRSSDILGPILRQLRKKKGWSQDELGKAIGLSQERISAIEARPEKVTFDQLLTVLMALDAEFIIALRTEGGKSPNMQTKSNNKFAEW